MFRFRLRAENQQSLRLVKIIKKEWMKDLIKNHRNTHCILLSHPGNDRDVTERAQGYTLQDASFMR